jgi:ABC-type dipeptide/oligopeptide/nickel transport system permease subunit
MDKRRNAWQNLRRLPRSPAAFVAGLVLILSILGAVGAPIVARFTPDQISAGPALEAPTRGHPFGTDQHGRDVFSRILYGARLSLPVGLAAVGFAAVCGSALGLATGFYGGAVDSLGRKVIDIWLGFPEIMLALLIIAILGIGIRNVILAVGLSGTPRFARIVRGSTMAIRETAYVEAIRASGASSSRIVFRHILPNVRALIIVMATLYLGRAVLESAALGFLGMGVQPPSPEWGTMLSEGREFMRYAPWLMLIPGGVLFLTVVSVNLLGDYMRQLLDPRLRGQQSK